MGFAFWRLGTFLYSAECAQTSWPFVFSHRQGTPLVRHLPALNRHQRKIGQAKVGQGRYDAGRDIYAPTDVIGFGTIPLRRLGRAVYVYPRTPSLLGLDQRIRIPIQTAKQVSARIAQATPTLTIKLGIVI